MNKKHIIIFDGICNLCNTSIQFIIKYDKKDIFRFIPMQSEKAKQIVSKFNQDVSYVDSVIVVQNSLLLFKSDAALLILKLLGYPWKSFYFLKFIPKFIRDMIYDIVANKRYNWFGKKESCMIPTDEIKSKFLE